MIGASMNSANSAQNAVAKGPLRLMRIASPSGASTTRVQVSMTAMIATSSTIAMAAPSGQFRVFRNSSWTAVAATLTRRPPRIAGVAKAAGRQREDDQRSRQDARHGLRHHDAPKDRPRAGARAIPPRFRSPDPARCSAAQTASTMNGTMTCTSASTIPPEVYIIFIGREIRPSRGSARLRRRCCPG